MLKLFEQKYIRKMAYMYMSSNINLSRRQAIFKASKAYEFYRETEVEMMYEEFEKSIRT